MVLLEKFLKRLRDTEEDRVSLGRSIPRVQLASWKENMWMFCMVVKAFREYRECRGVFQKGTGAVIT